MNNPTEQTKHCPSCDKEISIRAKRCPYCREDLRGWFRRHPILTVLLVIITSPFWIAVIVGFYQGITGSTSNSNGNVTPTPEREFNASVNFTGTQFVVNNLDKSDCENSKMEINGGLFKGGYSLDGYLLEAGHQYTVGAAQFTDKDGTRFNPFTTKPQNFSISCKGNNDLQFGFWYGEFK